MRFLSHPSLDSARLGSARNVVAPHRRGPSPPTAPSSAQNQYRRRYRRRRHRRRSTQAFPPPPFPSSCENFDRVFSIEAFSFFSFFILFLLISRKVWKRKNGKGKGSFLPFLDDRVSVSLGQTVRAGLNRSRSPARKSGKSIAVNPGG